VFLAAGVQFSSSINKELDKILYIGEKGIRANLSQNSGNPQIAIQFGDSENI